MKENYQNKVLERLYQLGFSIGDKDIPLIESAISKTQTYFSSYCGNTINPKLMPYFIDHVCGVFLKDQCRFSQGNYSGLNNQAVSSVKIGDTSISFENSSTGNSADLNSLFCPKEVLKCFRRIIWQP